MKIALAQINPTVGDFESNTRKIISFVNRAKEQNADIVIFPEMAVCGYPPEDLVFKKRFQKKNDHYLNKIRNISDGILIAVGCLNVSKNRIFNSAAIFHDKKVKDIYHKLILPNYGVFDEKRHFQPGDTIPIYEYKNKKFTINICEDSWIENEYMDSLGKNHNLDFLINISASPFSLKKFHLRNTILSRKAKTLKCPIIYCNMVGGQDEIIFDGTSMIISRAGKIIKMGKRFKEDLIIFDTEKDKKSQKIKILSDTEQAYNALVLGLKDYVTKNSFKQVVLGISGGIDSAVTAVLASEAVGSENVFAILMPSKYTSKETFNDSLELCKRLNIKNYTFKISDIFNSYHQNLSKIIDLNQKDITEQNLQARIRGNIIMAFSNKHKCLAINTGNKSEVSVGYCTLYGDMIGGFGLLKDVYKTTVYKIANFINKIYRNKPIPESIIKRPPSAELKPNQKDEDDIPEYKILDKVLKLYIEENQSFEEIKNKGFDKNIVKKIISLVDRNEYKRRQSPPGIKITEIAFGKDRRMPITNCFSD